MQKFLKNWGGQLFFQAIGPLSAFCTIWYIAKMGGPILQGRFAVYKGLIDFLFIIGSFGFPQAIVYTINKTQISARKVATLSTIYSGALIPIFFFAALIIPANFFDSSGIQIQRESPTAAILIASAAGMLVLHGLWRAIYLSQNQNLGFALISILPPTILLLVIAVTFPSKQANDNYFPIAFLLANAISVFLIAKMITGVSKANAHYSSDERFLWSELFKHGIHSFSQGAFLAAQPLIAYAAIKLAHGNSEDIGFLNIGILLVQGLSVPISMIAPLLFAKWTQNSASPDTLIRASGSKPWTYVVLHTILGIALAIGTHNLVPVIFGKNYFPAAAPAALIMLSFPILCHARVLTPAFHSLGQPEVNTKFTLLRLVIFSSSIALLPYIISTNKNSSIDIATLIAAIWTLSEIISGLQYIFFSKRYLPSSI